MKPLYGENQKRRLFMKPWKVYADEDVRDSIRRIPFINTFIWQAYEGGDSLTESFPIFDYRSLNGYFGEIRILAQEAIPIEMINESLWLEWRKGTLFDRSQRPGRLAMLGLKLWALFERPPVGVKTKGATG